MKEEGRKGRDGRKREEQGEEEEEGGICLSIWKTTFQVFYTDFILSTTTFKGGCC